VPEGLVRFRVRATGEERWSVVCANPVYDADGAVELSVSVIRDITAERTAHEEHARAEERIRFLARASALLSETLDYELTLVSIAEMAVPTLGGQVVIDLVEDDGSTRCVAAAHSDPEKSERVKDLRRRYPPTAADHPVQHAIRTGGTVFIPDLQEHVDEMAHDATHADEIRSLANTSGIVVPLIARVFVGSTRGSPRDRSRLTLAW